MRVKKVPTSVLVEAYGVTAGLVAPEDLLEEIVGEIRGDDDQAEEGPLQILSPTEALVDARYPMDELNSRLGLGISESAEYDSVGGYVVGSLGAIPAPGALMQGGRAKGKAGQARGTRVEPARRSAEEPCPGDELVV